MERNARNKNPMKKKIMNTVFASSCQNESLTQKKQPKP